jgi:hypothetical protein
MINFLIKNKFKLILIISLAFIFCILIVRFQFQFFQITFREKSWVHRVNDIQKLNSINNGFTGVELDILYVDSLNVFDVYHPPDMSNQLYLETYFIEDKNHHRYWLDFKNLTKKNQLKALKRLNYILDVYKLDKKNIIVESTNSILLESFHENNYLTSYYLPNNLYRLKKDDLKKKIKNIKVNVNLQTTKYMSFNYRDY